MRLTRDHSRVTAAVTFSTVKQNLLDARQHAVAAEKKMVAAMYNYSPQEQA